MRAIAVDLLLCLAVLAAWLAVAAALRCRTSLDRLHAVGFVGLVPFALMAIAAFVQEGINTRAVNLLFLLLVLLLLGPAVTHVTGRAIASFKRSQT